MEKSFQLLTATNTFLTDPLTSNENKEEEWTKVGKTVKSCIIFISAFNGGWPFLHKDSKSMERMRARIEGEEKHFGEGDSKSRMKVIRYYLVEERIFASNLFTRILKGKSDNRTEILTVNNLIGIEGAVFLFGMLVQKEEGNYYLEDLTASVQIKLADCHTGHGFFPVNSFIIGSGIYENGLLYMNSLVHPPLRHHTDKQIHSIREDFFGAHTLVAKDLELIPTPIQFTLQPKIPRIIYPTSHDQDSMLILISNLNLDASGVLPKLEEMFKGFEHSTPQIIILMGDFISNPSKDLFKTLALFESLALLISNFPNLSTKTQWLLIPGLNDPGITESLPKNGLGEIFMAPLRKRISKVRAESNPCRISYYGKEIVICRYDYMKLIKRNSIILEQKEESDSFNLGYTILAQGNLCPLPHSVRPVVWEYSDQLLLYHTPDYLILGDLCADYVEKIEGCIVLNPGNFIKDYSFSVIFPLLGEVQPSKL